MLLLARTTPLAEVAKKTDGLSIFWSDLREAISAGMTVRPIRNMVNHETNEVFFDHFEVPATNLVGEEGKGFKYILDGMNAERILIAAECIGDGYWFIDKARQYAKERIVFDRPIGKNQGVQFPIARAYANVRAADLMRYEAARLFDEGSRREPRRIWQSSSPPTRHGKRRMRACRRSVGLALPWSTTSSASFARRGSIRSRQCRPI